MSPLIISGSAGSFTILIKILASLKKDFSFPLVICVHRSMSGNDEFVSTLRNKTRAPIREAGSVDSLKNGEILVAPAGFHLVFSSKKNIRLENTKAVNYFKPSIDVCMLSAAKVLAPSVTGILLTGANHDGATGMEAIHKAGGVTIVQDPTDAHVPAMPEAALKAFQPDYILSEDKIITFIENMMNNQ